ncbi:MAG: selenocysteine-specific translation elongation factor [Anaerolineales bacterium]
MFIIGTAGHVDHGKSTLIEAITGTHPDRLREEREREMSIVLGFDTFQLPDGKRISIVDVPGHRDFIENMLSGIGSIDATLFVIAADEGVMPQTREHLAILDLLEVEKGVIVLTKIDLVDDPEWLDLVEVEIQDLVSSTALKNAPVVRVSAKEKTGLDQLFIALSDVLADQSPRIDLGRPRLSVDRIFLMSGFGSIVTGTLLDGTFKVGDEISLLPSTKSGRIRGLQTHNQDLNEVGPGYRTAINISGIENVDINRGDVVTHPGDYSPTRRLDVQFRYLADIEKPLTHDLECKFFLGADETIARVRLLGSEILKPGETAWLQLEVEDPVIAMRGDHFILRRPSPSETLGGGIVLDPYPPYRHKRFDQEILDHLETLSAGDPVDVLRQTISRANVLLWEEALDQSGLDKEIGEESLNQLLESGLVLLLEDGSTTNKYVSMRSTWDEIKINLVGMIEKYHREYPLRSGMSREELKNQSGFPGPVYNLVIEALIKDEKISRLGPEVLMEGFLISFSSEQTELVNNLMERFKQNSFLPPSVKECREDVGEELYNALLSLKRLQQISPEVVFTPETYQKMISEVKNILEKDQTITVARARDHFGSSRKYMLAFLEKLDSEGFTVREGDVRRLKE